MIRVATVGALALSLSSPVNTLVWLLAVPRSAQVSLAVVLGLALYTPLHVRHVWYAARGVRPPYGGWTLAVQAVVIAAAFPLVGFQWSITLYSLGASVLVVLRPPWSVVAAAGIAVSLFPITALFGRPERAWYYLVGYVEYGLGVALLAYLVVAVRRLQESRAELARDAVVRERLRIDAELGRTVGAELTDIVRRGQLATTLVESGDQAALRAELAALVEASRSALAEARRTVRRYQHVSLRAELDSAITLLAAAGIRTTLIGQPDLVDDDLRAQLRAGIAAVLRAGAGVTQCVIEVVQQDRPELRISAEREPVGS